MVRISGETPSATIINRNQTFELMDWKLETSRDIFGPWHRTLSGRMRYRDFMSMSVGTTYEFLVEHNEEVRYFGKVILNDGHFSSMYDHPEVDFVVTETTRVTV